MPLTGLAIIHKALRIKLLQKNDIAVCRHGMLLAYIQEVLEKLKRYLRYMRAESENLIDRSVELAVELCDVSEKGQAASEDSGCSVFFGIVRDCAYAIMLRAETEKKRKVNGCLKGGLKEGVKR